MKKVLEEVGKGIINFANIITALVFVKSYFDGSESNMLFLAAYSFVGLYVVASVFIKLSERIKDE